MATHRIDNPRSSYGCHAQTNTSLIFVAVACIFHEAPLLQFFFYHLSPKADAAHALSILVYLVCD